MKNNDFVYRGGGETATSSFIVTSKSHSQQEFRVTENSANASSLTNIIEVLEFFEDFDPIVRAAAISLRASELKINPSHFYAIALHAGLGGAS